MRCPEGFRPTGAHCHAARPCLPAPGIFCPRFPGMTRLSAASHQTLNVEGSRTNAFPAVTYKVCRDPVLAETSFFTQ